MKRLLSLSLVLGLLFLSCSKETPGSPEKPDKPDTPVTPPTPPDEIVLTGESSDGKIEFGSDASSTTLSFTSTGDWRVSVPSAAASWCNVNPSSGSTSPAQVSVNVKANDSYDERNATLTISSGTATQKVVVSQKQLDAMLLSSSKVEVSEEGGAFSIKLEANVPVTYEIPAQYTWLHEATASRTLTETAYNFTADANDSGEGRQGEIIFSGAGKTETVNVYQPSLKNLVLSEKEKYISADGGRFSVELRSISDFTYSIEEGCTWLHEDVSRAMSSHTLYFIADPYDNLESNRSATISFLPVEGEGEGETLTVIQTSPGSLVLGPQNIEATCGGGLYEIGYTSNKRMKVTVPHWCNVIESRAMESHSVAIEVTENLSENPRSGEIVLTAYEDPTLTQSISVNQEGLKYTINHPFSEGDYNDARSHDFQVTVDSPIKFDIEASAPIIKISNGNFRMPANYRKDISGNGTLLLKVNGTLVETIMVAYAAMETPVIANSDIKVKAESDYASVSIKTNTDIDYTITSGSQWLSIGNIEKASKGMSDDLWTFTLAPNTTDSPRSAIIDFTAGNMWSGRVNITQEAKRSASGETATVEIPIGGSLEEALGDKALEIGDLTLSGEVGGKDIVTIRQMVTDGKLTVLDMTNSDIKKDLANSYYVEGASIYRPTKTTEDNMIGHWLFFKSNIRDITFPTNLEHIGYCAFEGSKIERVDLPEGLQTMEERAFKDCTELRSVSLPSTLTKIENYTFELCPALEEVKLSEGLRSIGNFAFAPYEAYIDDCNLRSIVLPSTVEHLGRRCFMSTKITNITIPESVISMGDGIFTECRSLNSIKFLCSAEELPERILYNVLNLQEIVFPKGLKVIGEYALDHAGLPNLVIPEGVTTLKKGALNGSGYHSLVLPESLEEIGAFALGYQSRVSSFTIPSNVRKIGNRAFDGACYFTSLHMKCATPPEHEGDIFSSSFKYKNCTLYVPAGSKAAYQADSYWLKFKDIVEE